MLHTHKITQSIAHSNKAANTYLGAHNQHRFGLARSTNTPAEVIQNSMFSSSHYYPQTIQMPATISFRRRHNRQRVTTSLPIIVTTPLRGDQKPPSDDEDNEYEHNFKNQDEIEAFIPLGVKNQPVTVPPIYFINERDNTERRIYTAFTYTPNNNKNLIKKGII